MKIIENQTFDQERALYGVRNVKTVNCRFDGPADGESAFKECAGIAAENCFVNLRYPFSHDRGLEVKGCELTENCRAALWYSGASAWRTPASTASRPCGSAPTWN